MLVVLAGPVKFSGYAIEGEGCHMKAALVSEWCVIGNVMEYLKQYPESNRIALVGEIPDFVGGHSNTVLDLGYGPWIKPSSYSIPGSYPW